MVDPDPTAAQTRGLRWAVIAFGFNSVSAYLTYFGPQFALFLDELQLNKAQIGLLFSLFPFAGLLALVASHPLARIGFKRSYMAFWSARYVAASGMLLIPAVFAAGGQGAAALLIAATALLFAVSRALAETAYYPWTQEFVPRRVRGRFFAVYYAVFNLVAFLSFMVAGYVVDRGQGLTRFTSLIAVGVVSGFICVLFTSRIPGGAPMHGEIGPRATGSSFLQALRDLNLRRYLGAEQLLLLGSIPMLSFTPLFMRDRLGLHDGFIVYSQGAYMLGAMTGSLLSGWSSDRKGSKPVMFGAGILIVLVPLLWLAFPRSGSAVTFLAPALMFLWGIAIQGFLVSSSRIFYGDVTPMEKRTSYTALHYAAQGVVGGAGPLLAGMLLQGSALVAGWGWDAYAILFVVSFFVSAAALPLLARVRADCCADAVSAPAA